MSKICEITGKKVITGNTVSHSHHKEKRTFKANIQKKKFFIPEENTTVVLTVSAAGMRTIAKKGITAAIRDAKTAGHYRH